jgi:signal transduction histidine kinase
MSIDSDTLQMSVASHIAPAPVPEWDAPDSHRHIVHFYDDDRFLAEGLARFVGSVLGAGDSAVVIATAAHRQDLAARLAARGLVLDVASSEGRYVALDAAETLASLMVDGEPDAERFFDVVGEVVTRAAEAAKSEAAEVAAFGEMVALLWSEGRRDAALQLERLWNRLAAMSTFTLHCAYPIGCFRDASDAQAMANVCAEHAGVMPAESYASLATDDERLRMIAQLQQRSEALEIELDRRKDFDHQKDAFLSAAAHDLKTPLTSVQGLVQILVRRLSRTAFQQAEYVVETLEAIQSGTRKMSALIDELLDAARLEAMGTLTLNRQDVDLVDLVRDVAREQQLATHRHSLKMTSDVEHIIGSLDSGRIERAITNVVSNAVKYSPDGGDIEITIAAEDVEGRQCAVVKVGDHGIGIPAADIDRVFQRFQRGSNVAEQLPGNGIGLSYVREIVLQHGGTLTLQSQEGTGTTIGLRLPL